MSSCAAIHLTLDKLKTRLQKHCMWPGRHQAACYEMTSHSRHTTFCHAATQSKLCYRYPNRRTLHFSTKTIQHVPIFQKSPTDELPDELAYPGCVNTRILRMKIDVKTTSSMWQFQQGALMSYFVMQQIFSLKSQEMHSVEHEYSATCYVPVTA